MCERLSVFLLIDKQWRLNLVKKRKNKHQRHTHASLPHVLPFFVLPHFDITYDVPLSEKTHSKICYKFPSYHLSVEPEDEHGGIDASTQQLQRESKWKRASRKT